METSGKNGHFYSPSHGKLEILEMTQKIKDFLDSDLKKEYLLVIGSDSQEKNPIINGNRHIEIVTAVTIHKKGSGGIYFYSKKKVKIPNTPKKNVRGKIYAETMASLTFAEYFIPILKENLNGHSPMLEIHVDIGEHGESRNVIKEVVGMVTGSGYIAKTKPLSFGASNVADKHTK